MKLALIRVGMPLLASAVVLLSACGGKTDNPDAVTLENLKFPNGLTVRDQGNGSVVLTWYGSNFEEKFDGYNVFGMKRTDAELTTLGLTKGKPLQLLDATGAPIEGAKTALTKFNYGSDLEAPAEVPAAPDEKNSAGSDAKISFLPIHTKDAKGAAILPSCQPKNNVCVATTEANRQTSGITQNGPLTMTLTGLKPGSQYCFLVFSVLDEGKQISQTSSNLECVVPRYEKAVTFAAIATGSTESVSYDLRTYLTACGTAGSCAALTGSSATTGASSTSELPLYLEGYGASETLVYFVAGKNSAIQDLGYYANGFNDATLPRYAPALNYSFNGTTDKTANRGGYSIPGQSLILKTKHMYVLAVGDKDSAAPTSFRYHWIYISGASDPVRGTAFEATVRLSVNADER